MKTLAKIFTIISIIISTNTFSKPNNILKNGLYFQIKLENTLLKDILYLEHLFKYITIEHQENAEIATCYVGVFKTKEEASVAENTLRFKGYSNAITIAFFNEQEITAKEAITFLNNQNKIDLASDAVRLDEIELMIQATKNPDAFHYSVQVWVTDFEQAEHLIEYTYSSQEYITELQQGNYAIGKYKTMDEAKEALSNIQHAGMKHTHITSYYNSNQLSALAAKELESYFKNSLAIK